MKSTTYRIWTSSKGWQDCTVNGWLADALLKARIKQPYRVEFESHGCWYSVSGHAVRSAIKQAWGITA